MFRVAEFTVAEIGSPKTTARTEAWQPAPRALPVVSSSGRECSTTTGTRSRCARPQATGTLEANLPVVLASMAA